MDRQGSGLRTRIDRTGGTSHLALLAGERGTCLGRRRGARKRGQNGVNGAHISRFRDTCGYPPIRVGAVLSGQARGVSTLKSQHLVRDSLGRIRGDHQLPYRSSLVGVGPGYR
eukprot:11914131-Heterocapsa_arctica.AAC.1